MGRDPWNYAAAWNPKTHVRCEHCRLKARKLPEAKPWTMRTVAKDILPRGSAGWGGCRLRFNPATSPLQYQCAWNTCPACYFCHCYRTRNTVWLQSLFFLNKSFCSFVSYASLVWFECVPPKFVYQKLNSQCNITERRSLIGGAWVIRLHPLMD